MIPLHPYSKLRVWSFDDLPCELAQSLQCHELVALALYIKYGEHLDFQKARAWLRPSLDLLMSNLFLCSSGRDVFAILQSLPRGSKVALYGDYDVDGVASALLASEFASSMGWHARYYLPHRLKDGYGLNAAVVKTIARMGFNLLIVTDCGTKNETEIEQALNMGLKVVIFDHHHADTICHHGCIINPYLGGDNEAKTLSATGVLWCWLWQSGLISKDWLMERLEIVALSVVGDSMPLGVLNRALVKEGLKGLEITRRPGLQYLFDKLSIVYPMDENQIAMKINPCLNSAGRISLAEIALQALEASPKSKLAARELLSLNYQRKKLSSTVYDQATSRLRTGHFRYVLDSAHWPLGLLSSVASRLCYEYNRPIILAAPHGRNMRASLRVPEGLNAIKVLEGIASYLASWGGHKGAAGFSVEAKRWSSVKKKLEESLTEISANCSEDRFEDAISLEPKTWNLKLWNCFRELAPFGEGNEMPYFFVSHEVGDVIKPLRGGGNYRVSSQRGELLAFGFDEMSRYNNRIKGWLYRPFVDSFRGKLKISSKVEKVVV